MGKGYKKTYRVTGKQLPRLIKGSSLTEVIPLWRHLGLCPTSGEKKWNYSEMPLFSLNVMHCLQLIIHRHSSPHEWFMRGQLFPGPLLLSCTYHRRLPQAGYARIWAPEKCKCFFSSKTSIFSNEGQATMHPNSSIKGDGMGKWVI